MYCIGIEEPKNNGYDFNALKNQLHEDIEVWGFDWEGPKVWMEENRDMSSFYSRKFPETGKELSVKFIAEGKDMNLLDTSTPYVDKIKMIIVFFDERDKNKDTDKKYQQTISFSPDGIELGTFSFMVSDYAKQNGHTSFESLATINIASKFECRSTIMSSEEYGKCFSHTYETKNVNFNKISNHLTNPEYVKMWESLESRQMDFGSSKTDDTYFI